MKKVVNILLILIVLSIVICGLQRYVSNVALGQISSENIINYAIK